MQEVGFFTYIYQEPFIISDTFSSNSVTHLKINKWGLLNQLNESLLRLFQDLRDASLLKQIAT